MAKSVPAWTATPLTVVHEGDMSCRASFGPSMNGRSTLLRTTRARRLRLTRRCSRADGAVAALPRAPAAERQYR
jgi:hypothetical protein